MRIEWSVRYSQPNTTFSRGHHNQSRQQIGVMSVNLVRKVRLRVGAGVAKPGPAIGQALGPLGLNMAEFCKQFNEKTKIYEKDTPIPVELCAFSNRSFTFKVKTPPTSWFIKKCAGVTLGSARSVSTRHLRLISKHFVTSNSYLLDF